MPKINLSQLDLEDWDECVDEVEHTPNRMKVQRHDYRGNGTREKKRERSDWNRDTIEQALAV